MPRSSLSLPFFILLSLAVLSDADTSDSPSLVINLFRHGARAPLSNSVDPTWDPSLYSMLTPAGMRMQYVLGAALAKTYPDILRQPYDSSKFYVRSSQAARCINSVTYQIYGAFQGLEPTLDEGYQSDVAVPPFDPETIEEVLQDLNDFQAGSGSAFSIDIDSVPVDVDIVLETPKTCPALYADALKNVMSLQATKFWFSTLSSTRSALKAAGLSAKSPISMNKVADAFHCDHYQEKPLPGGFSADSDVYKDVIFTANYFTVLAEYSSSRQKQMLSVPLFDEIFKILDDKLAGTSSYQFAFLSAHDITLLTILTALDYVNTDCMMDNYKSMKAGQNVLYPHCHFPEFASNIIIELYENDGYPYIVFKYDDVVVPLCGGDDCSYDEFKELVQNATNGYTVDDYESICLNGVKNNVQDVMDSIESFFGDKN